MEKDNLAFGIDIGGTNTKIGLFDGEGNLLHYKIHPTLKEEPPEKFIEKLSLECDEILFSLLGIHLDHARVLGVGAGAPMANYFTGRVDHAPNLGWKNVPLQDLLSLHFKNPAVIENDANLAALGEKKWGAGKSLKDFILITLGTGVGTGLILDGRLYRGHNALGAEGGHMLIPSSEKRPCTCGGFNHLESFLSSRGIKETILKLSGKNWSIEELGEKFHQKDSEAHLIMQRIALELASGLVTMAVLFGPEAFVMGGGVSKLGESFFELTLEKFNELVHFSLKNKVKIISAKLSQDQGAIYGGGAIIMDEVLGKKSFIL